MYTFCVFFLFLFSFARCIWFWQRMENELMNHLYFLFLHLSILIFVFIFLQNELPMSDRIVNQCRLEVKLYGSCTYFCNYNCQLLCQVLYFCVHKYYWTLSCNNDCLKLNFYSFYVYFYSKFWLFGAWGTWGGYLSRLSAKRGAKYVNSCKFHANTVCNSQAKSHSSNNQFAKFFIMNSNLWNLNWAKKIVGSIIIWKLMLLNFTQSFRAFAWWNLDVVMLLFKKQIVLWNQ